MKSPFVDESISVLFTEVGVIPGHSIKTESNKYFVSPRNGRIRVFEHNKTSISLLMNLEISDELIKNTRSKGDFIQYIYDEIIPILQEVEI